MEERKSASGIKVQLFISCRKLKNVETFSHSDPFVEIFTKTSKGQWVKFGQTEVVWNDLNPDFTTIFMMDYQFEVQKFLLFQVFDANMEKGKEVKGLQLGEAQCTLGEIAGAKGQQVIKTLKVPGAKRGSGAIIVKLEEVIVENNDEIYIEFFAKGLKDGSQWYLLHKFSPFFYLSRLKEDGSAQRIFCSEQSKGTEPVWPPVIKSLTDLCNSNFTRPIKFELFDHYSTGSHEPIGSFNFTIQSLVIDKQKSFDLIDEKSKKKVGKIEVSRASLTKLYGFLEYIAGGCQISLLIGVDFTASNGVTRMPNSLHYLRPDGYNHYQAALHSVAEILLYYDSDKMVPVFGFGGKVNKKLNHCFPLNFNQSEPEVEGLNGIMEAYQQALGQVELSGPTLFAEVVRTAVTLAENASVNQRNQQYFILLILTDGEIFDLKETIDIIVRGSRAPLSIVIVGIGSENFDNMEQLDADKTPLLSSQGERMLRDIVQFVPFRDFGYSPEALAREVLAEIPREITNYFRIRSITPNEPMTATDFERAYSHMNESGFV